MSLTDANKPKIREFKDSFCLYTAVREVLADLESLYQSAEIGGDQLSMLLCGDAGTGKSAIIRYFSETKNQNQSESFPILLSSVPSKFTVEDTIRHLLCDLGVFGSSSHRYKNTQSDAHHTRYH